MFLLETVDEFGKLDKVVSIAAARLCYAVNKLTDHLIQRDEDKVRGSIKVSAPTRAKASWTICGDPLFKQMERALHEWLKGEAQSGLSLRDALVRENANCYATCYAETGVRRRNFSCL
jgi:hypothetical protein